MCDGRTGSPPRGPFLPRTIPADASPPREVATLILDSLRVAPASSRGPSGVPPAHGTKWSCSLHSLPEMIFVAPYVAPPTSPGPASQHTQGPAGPTKTDKRKKITEPLFYQHVFSVILHTFPIEQKEYLQKKRATGHIKTRPTHITRFPSRFLNRPSLSGHTPSGWSSFRKLTHKPATELPLEAC